MTKDKNKKTTKSRKCDICGNDLKDDEKKYCNLCDVQTDDLIPDEDLEEEEE